MEEFQTETVRVVPWESLAFAPVMVMPYQLRVARTLSAVSASVQVEVVGFGENRRGHAQGRLLAESATGAENTPFGVTVTVTAWTPVGGIVVDDGEREVASRASLHDEGRADGVDDRAARARDGSRP